MRSNRKLDMPTFAQTVAILQTMPIAQWADVEAIIQQHLALGFHYSKDQISRALTALTRDPTPDPRHNRRSARWT